MGENAKNEKEVRCLHCESIVLKPDSAVLFTENFDLPKSRQPTKATPADIETERLSSWWMVADMYTFENIGFSHAVGTIKYLVCADCEVGPIGYHDKTTAKSYISHDRVRHV